MLTNKFAIVTGGGRGIGRGITLALLEAGATVMIVQRQSLDSTLSHNNRVHWCQADLADVHAPQQIVKAIPEQVNTVDILVNNAGFMFELSLDEMIEADWDRMMTVNMRAPVFITKALLPLLRAKGAASIINIGSIEGLAANPHHIAYCATKSGVHGFTKALAVDLGKDGIRCNAIAPGWINTDLSDQYIGAQKNPAQAREELLKLHPIGRTGEPSDIGEMVAFLASDASKFITGQIIVVDGGRTSKLPLPF